VWQSALAKKWQVVAVTEGIVKVNNVGHAGFSLFIYRVGDAA
jgi:hypothetical protein